MKHLSQKDADEYWMAEAVGVAAKGLGRTAPNPAVGCVLVRGSRKIGEGYHRKVGSDHAEAAALKVAGARARGTTAYVTLEPCSHQGRTPPCATALLQAQVARVVVGVRDPNPAVSGKGLARLRRGGVEVSSGVLPDQCAELVRGFSSHVRLRRPWVHLKLAASMDGRIAARGGDSKWISCPASRRVVQSFRARSEAVLVGAGTVTADDPRLTCRSGGPNPLRVVLDPKLATRPDARVISEKGSCLLVTTASAKAVARRRLERSGAEVIALDTRGKSGWARLLRELGKRDVMELLVEGGAAIATSLVRARAVDRITVFYNPRWIGGDGVPMLESLGVGRAAGAVNLVTQDWLRVGTDMMWTGRIA